MSRIRIVHEPESLPEGAAPVNGLDASAGWGTRLWINERELEQVSAIDVRIRPDEVIAVSATVLAGPDLSCEFPADVTVSIVPRDMTGWAIEETPLPDGGTRYRAVQELNQ